MKQCSISDCHDKYKSNGYCAKHYNRWRRNGNPLVLKRKNTDDIRYCSQCQLPKKLNYQNFTKDFNCKAGLRYSCRDCDKIKLYPQHKFAQYGLTIDGYNQLLKKQNYCCAICKQEKLLQVDHNHSIKGKVESRRGLLCISCNNMIKCENVDYLIAGIHYLNLWNGYY